MNRCPHRQVAWCFKCHGLELLAAGYRPRYLLTDAEIDEALGSVVSRAPAPQVDREAVSTASKARLRTARQRVLAPPDQDPQLNLFG